MDPAATNALSQAYAQTDSPPTEHSADSTENPHTDPPSHSDTAHAPHTNPAPQTSFSLFDAFSPASLAQELAALADSTDRLIEIMAATPASSIRPLIRATASLNNFRLPALIEASRSPRRSLRFAATHVFLARVKSLVQPKMIRTAPTAADTAEELYEAVLLTRVRDVDPRLRAACLQFLADWVCASAVFRRPEHLRHFLVALSDRSESVVARALRCLLRIARRLEPALLLPFQERLVAMLERGEGLGAEAAAVVLCLYGTHGLLTDDAAVAALAAAAPMSRERLAALQRLCPDGLAVFDRLHEVCAVARRSGVCMARVFRGFESHAGVAAGEGLTCFAEGLLGALQDSAQCCDNLYPCLLDLLVPLAPALPLAFFKAAVETTQENPHATERLLAALTARGALNDDPAAAEALIACVTGVSLAAPVCVAPLCQLLAANQAVLPAVVTAAVARVARVAPLVALQHFDVTDVVGDGGSLLEQCYAVMWHLARQDSARVMSMRLQCADKSCMAEPAQFYNLALFLDAFVGLAQQFLRSAWLPALSAGSEAGRAQCAANEPENVLGNTNRDAECEYKAACEGRAAENASARQTSDTLSMAKAIQHIATDLYAIIAAQPLFDSPEGAKALFPLLTRGLFTDAARYLFIHCELEYLDAFINGRIKIEMIAGTSRTADFGIAEGQSGSREAVTRLLDALVHGFFEALPVRREISSLARVIVHRAGKAGHSSVFRPIRQFLACNSPRAFTDAVLLPFVPLLSSEECIVLEAEAPAKSRFKSACMRRIRRGGKPDKNSSFI